jgi:hypothetical protein
MLLYLSMRYCLRANVDTSHCDLSDFALSDGYIDAPVTKKTNMQSQHCVINEEIPADCVEFSSVLFLVAWNARSERVTEVRPFRKCHSGQKRRPILHDEQRRRPEIREENLVAKNIPKNSFQKSSKDVDFSRRIGLAGIQSFRPAAMS